jgi:hypothetical protein
MLLMHKGCHNSEIVLRMVTVAGGKTSHAYASMWVSLSHLVIHCERGRLDWERSNIVDSSLLDIKA